LSDDQKKTIHRIIEESEKTDIIKTLIAQEVSKRDADLTRLQERLDNKKTQAGTTGTTGKVKVEDIYPPLNRIPGVSMFSDIGREDGKFAVKIGYPGCPGCDHLSNEIKGINGPVIDVDTNRVPPQFKQIWLEQVNKYGDLNRKGERTVPIVVYFQRNNEGKVTVIGGDGYGNGKIVSNIKSFFGE
jgi:hypothetical protein